MTRIAIISTPRSGNTWVRHVLRDVYELPEIACHNPNEIPADLPANVILQLHWYREPNFQRIIKENGFTPIVVGRHPLDALLSALHFVRWGRQTMRWLEGNAELPPTLQAASPASPAFLDYATGWGAENFLGISYAWWHEPTAIRVKYEDLVQDPKATFAGIVERIGPPPSAWRDRLDGALADASLDVFKATRQHHGWQGRPGLWRSLIPPLNAARIRARHREIFRYMDYRVGPYWLSRRAAERNWARLEIRPTAEPPGDAR